MLSAYADTTVQLGINPQMDPKQAHGSVTYRDINGRVRSVFFQVDRPKRLKHPTEDAVRDMFRQLIRLGYAVNAINVTSGRRKPKVYRSPLAPYVINGY